jgi:hypothetical protein
MANGPEIKYYHARQLLLWCGGGGKTLALLIPSQHTVTPIE